MNLPSAPAQVRVNSDQHRTTGTRLQGPWLSLVRLLWVARTILAESYSSLFTLGAYSFLGGFVVAQLYRYHSVSSRTERQQTKWIVFGVTVTYLIELGITLCYGFFPLFFSTGSLGDRILSPISTGVPILIPLSFGFAILRYRLWEIDAIINRTLVYGTLTVLLALGYVGFVIALQSLALVLKEQLSHNPIIVFASTLVSAALFQPLRRRLQIAIDRRFYRRKYNAVQTIAAFSTRLRLNEDVDLTTLTADLLAVVEETMQPAHDSLWLRNPEQFLGRNTQMLPRIDEELFL